MIRERLASSLRNLVSRLEGSTIPGDRGARLLCEEIGTEFASIVGLDGVRPGVAYRVSDDTLSISVGPADRPRAFMTGGGGIFQTIRPADRDMPTAVELRGFSRAIGDPAGVLERWKEFAGELRLFYASGVAS